MTEAFWDSSSIVPLCLQQKASSRAGELLHQYYPVIWWASSVEAQSAFARDLRNGVITSTERRQAQVRLEDLKSDWREILPSDPLRDTAELFLERFSLRATDALQLAAVFAWGGREVRSQLFISGDKRLLDAAHQLGFQIIET